MSAIGVQSRDLRTTWPKALLTFFAPIFVVFVVRWALIEPFVVPSGSMIPTLLIHDHIMANKLAYGLHWPFSSRWIVQWAQPKRGDIVVFRYPKNPEVYYVKRLVGLPGDTVSLQNGELIVNGSSNPSLEISVPQGGDGSFQYYQESTHQVRYIDKDSAHFEATAVPPGHYFAMGDNRDQSSDSRFWGFVPQENLVGRVGLVWLSCENTLPSASFICDPQTIRWSRLLIGVQ